MNPMHEAEILRQEYIPQITIDQVVQHINPEWIYFLSIDTEGYDMEVLRGSREALKRTFFVCVEYHGTEEKSALERFMRENSFRNVYSNDLNLIFRKAASPDELMRRLAEQGAVADVQHIKGESKSGAKKAEERHSDFACLL